MSSTLFKRRDALNWGLGGSITKQKGGANVSETASAYLAGYIAGQKESEDIRAKIMLDGLIGETKRAMKLCEELYNSMSYQGLNVAKVFLKIEILGAFDAVFIVPVEEWRTDKFDVAYELSNAIETKVNSSKFSIAFSFAPADGEADRKRMSDNGYDLSFPS